MDGCLSVVSSRKSCTALFCTIPACHRSREVSEGHWLVRLERANNTTALCGITVNFWCPPTRERRPNRTEVMIRGKDTKKWVSKQCIHRKTMICAMPCKCQQKLSCNTLGAIIPVSLQSLQLCKLSDPVCSATPPPPSGHWPLPLQGIPPLPH